MQKPNGLANADSQSFWAGVEAVRLLFQNCTDCGAVQFPPRYLCATCWSEKLTMVESCGKGTIESLTIVRRAPLAEFRARVPYVVAAIRVAEGPRMITNLVGEGIYEAAIGDSVAVVFADDEDGHILPQFQLDREG